MESYLQGSKNNYYNYLANKQFPDSDIDGFLVMMAAFYLGKVITVVSNACVLSTEEGVNHDIVLLHLGGQTFMDTGKKYFSTCQQAKETSPLLLRTTSHVEQ